MLKQGILFSNIGLKEATSEKTSMVRNDLLHIRDTCAEIRELVDGEIREAFAVPQMSGEFADAFAYECTELRTDVCNLMAIITDLESELQKVRAKIGGTEVKDEITLETCRSYFGQGHFNITREIIENPMHKPSEECITLREGIRTERETVHGSNMLLLPEMQTKQYMTLSVSSSSGVAKKWMRKNGAIIQIP